MKQSNADKLGTILGFVSGIVFILTGIIFPAEFSNIALWLESTGEAENYNKYLVQILRFFDLKSLIIVFGGTISATFKLSNQALGAVMMALQESLINQIDIVPILKRVV